MRWACLSGSMVAVFLTCTTASGAAALPLAGTGQAIAPMVQPAAHKPNEWHWHGHWWRSGPWSDHVIIGMYPRRGHHRIFVPRVAERLDNCTDKYHSYGPATETYVTKSGKCCVCR